MFNLAKQLILASALVALTLGPTLSFAQSAKADPMALGPGDVVRITVYGQPDLSTLTRLSENGEITFPLLGSVALDNMSTIEAERHVAGLLDSRGIVRNAQVTVFLEQRSERSAEQVTILGKVDRPGKYTLQSASVQGVSSVIDLLASAGGTIDGAADYVFLMRPTHDSYARTKIDLIQLVQFGELSVDRSLLNGDIVLVPETEVFYIYGQVRRPGRYPLERDMTVMQALSVASGVTDIGNESGIILRRRTDTGNQETEVAITEFLKPGDVVYVKERRF